MKITTQLTEKEFIKANFYMLFQPNKLLVIVLTPILLITLNIVARYLLNVETNFLFRTIFIVILFPSFLLINNYFNAKKSYRKNYAFQNPVNYVFENGKMTIESIDEAGTLGIDKLTKGVSTKEFIYLYRTKSLAHILRKDDMNEHQIQELKSILDKAFVKNNL